MRTGSVSEKETVLTLLVLPRAVALADGPLFGQPLLVGFAVGLHAPLGFGRGVVQRRGVGAAVIAEFLVQGVFVGDLILNAFPVYRVLLLPLADLLFEPVALLLQFGQRLQVDKHSLRVGPAADDDLRRNEGDHQHKIGYNGHAQADAVVVGPHAGILFAVVERQFETRTAHRLGFIVGYILCHRRLS